MNDALVSDDRWLRGLPVAVLGLGIEGRDLCRFLMGKGAWVTGFDTRDAAQLGSAVDELRGLGVELRLGPVDPVSADGYAALYVSQSVLLHRDPFVRRMRERGRPVSSMVREFQHRWPGPIAAITGSSGKTTTTSLVAAAFAAAGTAHIVGGNIGAGLLARIQDGTPSTWAVLEISHTQLQLVNSTVSVAAVTNVTPNHLDQFTWDEYVDLKRSLTRGQRGGAAVLNVTEPVCRSFARDTPADLRWFGADSDESNCCFVQGTDILVREGRELRTLIPVADVPLRGAHNIENVLAATEVALAAGLPHEAVADAIRGFRAVAHRLEYVAHIEGAAYYNDSIATSPERTLAGIRSFDEPLVLLLGGRDKHLPLNQMMAMAHARARAIVCFGEAGLLFEQAARQTTGARASIRRVRTLGEAVTAAHEVAQPGDVVLLSPAGTSFDAYPNFERRGEEFRSLVGSLARRPTSLETAEERAPSRP